MIIRNYLQYFENKYELSKWNTLNETIAPNKIKKDSIMRKMSKAAKRQLVLQRFIAFFPLIAIADGIIAIALGLLLQSWYVAWGSFIAGFYILPKLFFGGAPKKIENTYAKHWNNVSDSLESPDYVLTEIFGGIGVDIKNKKISVLNTTTDKNAKPKVFTASDVEEYGIAVEGYGEWDSINASTIDMSRMAMENQRNKAMADMKTGLYFTLDDIHTPKILACMTVETAERWMKIIEKFLNGSLDAPENKPMHYPEAEPQTA